MVDEFSGSVKKSFCDNSPYPSNDLGEWQNGTACSLGIGSYCGSNPSDVSGSPLGLYFVIASQMKETN